MNRLTVIVRAVVTVALLVFAYVSGDPQVATGVTGAVAGYWLRAGEDRAARTPPTDPHESR